MDKINLKSTDSEWWRASMRMKQMIEEKDKYSLVLSDENISRTYSVLELREKATEAFGVLKKFSEYYSSFAPLLFKGVDSLERIDSATALLSRICAEADIEINIDIAKQLDVK